MYESGKFPGYVPETQLAWGILKSGVVDIADIQGGQKPHPYTKNTPDTPNFGPLYIELKDIIGQDESFDQLAFQTALRVQDAELGFDFICGNANGGTIPGYRLKLFLDMLSDRRFPYTFKRKESEASAHGDLITGLAHNPNIHPGMRPLIVDELVNHATTSTGTASYLRTLGYNPTATVGYFSYENPEGLAALDRAGLEFVRTVRLPVMLETIENRGIFPERAIANCRQYIKDPKSWMSANRFPFNR